MTLRCGRAAGGITGGMKGATDGGGSPEGSGIFIRHPYIHIPILICLQVSFLHRHRRQCLGARSNIGITCANPAGYHPYVAQCGTTWQAVPANAPPVAAPASAPAPRLRHAWGRNLYRCKRRPFVANWRDPATVAGTPQPLSRPFLLPPAQGHRQVCTAEKHKFSSQAFPIPWPAHARHARNGCRRTAPQGGHSLIR